MKIKTVIIDDHRIVVEGLTKVLEAEGGVEVIGTAASLAEARALSRRVRPDVVLVDLRLPDAEGYEAIPAARRLFRDAKIVAITGYGAQSGLATEKYGADAFLSKEHASDLVTRTLFKLCPTSGPEAGVRATLTQREREVARLVARGMTNEEIAQHMGLSLNTVKTHCSAVLKKLGLRRRVDVARDLSHREGDA